MSSDFTTKSDLTSAINTMIACASESPISDVRDETNLMARLAYNTLVEIHRVVMSKGWRFNTDDNYILTPDSNGNIVVGSDVLDIDTDDYTDSAFDPCIRQGKLYSRKKQTFTWTGTLSTYIVRLQEFEDIPERVRRYITIRAARVFVQRHVGDDASFKFTAADESDALSNCAEYELDQSDYNMLDSPEAQTTLSRGTTGY